MITVVSLFEFTKLISKGYLEKSENTLFIRNNILRSVITDQINAISRENAEGFITILYGNKNNITNNITQDYSNEILLKLPRPEKPVYIILPDDLPSIKINIEDLNLLDNMDLEDSQIKVFADSVFSSNASSEFEYSYAFIQRIDKICIRSVIYDNDISSEILEIQKRDINNKIVYSETKLFNGERK